MTNTNTIKIGVMPGKIETYVVEQGTTVKQALELANLSAEGFEIKADGNTVVESDVISSGTNVILLTKKVKGNNEIKIGVMPGKIESFALESSTTVQEALNVAGLDSTGYEVKADGNTVTDFNQQIGSTNVILLTKKVKGNNEIKIGVMPGKIESYALDSSTTVKEALEFAQLSPDGYEVKADGNTVTDFNQAIGSSNVILLTKKVKGN